MPINDPIRGKKIAPASLAFEPNRLARGKGIASYQDNLSVENNITIVQHPTDLREVIARDERAMTAVANAERRAKHFVSDFQAVTQWDTFLDLNITHSKFIYDPIGFDHEVLRCVGSRFSGTATASNARWFYKPPKGYEGVWYFFSAMHAVIPPAALIESVYLAFFKNDSMWRVIDYMSAEMSGHSANYVEHVALRGGCHVPLDVNDEFDVRVLFKGNADIDTIYAVPSSAYAYVTGNRTSCDYTLINLPESGTITPV